MIILWIYVTVSVFAVLPTARLILRTVVVEGDRYEPEPFEYAAAAGAGLIAAPLWPLALVGYLVYRALRKETSA